MSELDELIAQRKEIDRKIRELKKTDIFFGNTKWSLQRFPRGDEWTVFIKKRTFDPHYDRWCSVIQMQDKEEAQHQLDLLIEDLKGLKTEIGADGNER